MNIPNKAQLRVLIGVHREHLYWVVIGILLLIIVFFAFSKGVRVHDQPSVLSDNITTPYPVKIIASELDPLSLIDLEANLLDELDPGGVNAFSRENSVEGLDGVVISQAGAGVFKDTQVLAGESSFLYDFSLEKYQQALNDHKNILLYFSASWCQECQDEMVNALLPMFDSLERDDIVGFRIHYNDTNTDKAERDLSIDFAVETQHTKVLLRNGRAVHVEDEVWDVLGYLQAFGDFFNY
jgi:thiol-disulfide isomerase/thioredoxin